MLATVGLKESGAARPAPSQAAEAGVETADVDEHTPGRAELSLGLYFVLGVAAIGAVTGLKRFARRSGHA